MANSISELSDILKHQKQVYLGIDPGTSGGGVAMINKEMELIYWDAFKNWSESEMLLFFEKIKLSTAFNPELSVFAALEKVSPMPSFGAKSNFEQGWSMGTLGMGLRVAGIQWEHVPPARWQKFFTTKKRTKDFGGNSPQWKGHLHDIALMSVPGKYPKYSADAVLLSIYSLKTK
jgi:hypothetical protein